MYGAYCTAFQRKQWNSYFIGSEQKGILLDAGRSAKQILQALAACEIPSDHVAAIFVTHEHSDHIRGCGFWPKN